MSKNKVFTPGEEITVEEEYSSGKNTYIDEKGLIRASVFGKAEFDEKEKEVRILSKEVKALETGDVIYGRVERVKESVAIIEIIKSEEYRILTVKLGQIPVRFASKNFVKDIRKLFKIGDFVKAKVILANDLVVDLATNEDGFGVITAYCGNCKKEMNYSNGKMTCFNCGHVEERKWFEEKEVRQPRPDFRRDDMNGRYNKNRNNDRYRDSRNQRNDRNNNDRNRFNNKRNFRRN